MPWTRVQRLVLAGAIAIGLVLGWIGRSADVTLGGDEATYLTLSHSLEEGRYNDEFLVGTPRHAQYPPGNPAWILAIRLVAGDDLDAVRTVNLVAIVLAALLLADALRRLGLTTIGVAAGALTAINPALGWLAGTALSESPYILFTSVALWTTVLVAARTSGRMVLLAASFALLAFFTRSIGVATIAAVIVSAMRRARLVTSIVTLACIIGIAAGWFAYTRSAASNSIGHSYAVDLEQAQASRQWTISAVGWKGIHYLKHLPATQLGLPDAPGTWVDTAAFAALLLVLLLAGIVPLIRSWPEAATFVLGSAAVLVVWPWADVRLLTPAMPWIIVTILIGVRAITPHGFTHPERPVVVVASVLGAFGLLTFALQAIRANGCRGDAPYQAAACFRAEERDFARAVAYLRDSLPANAVIHTTKPSTVFVLSGRQALPPWEVFGVGGVERFRRGEFGTHLLISGFLEQEQRAAGGTLRDDCSGLVAVAAFPRALLLGPRPLSGEGADACAHLARLGRAAAPD